MPIIVAVSNDYTPARSRISSVGKLTHLADNADRDVAGNPLQGGGKASFQPQTSFSTGTKPAAVALVISTATEFPTWLFQLR